jgi:hypothetical protein
VFTALGVPGLFFSETLVLAPGSETVSSTGSSERVIGSSKFPSLHDADAMIAKAQRIDLVFMICFLDFGLSWCKPGGAVSGIT